MSDVLAERRGAVALITINRPERRNGVTVALCEGFYAAVREVAQSDARVLVLRGAGDHFCVGADIGAAPEVDARAAQPDPVIYHASTLLHTMPQVTIAAIDGGCAGAGMGWAMACDLRFATPRARFSTAFLTVGVSGDMGLAWSLDRIVGGPKARELLFFPDRFGAEEALHMGLVTRLFEPEALHEGTLALAQELSEHDAMALRLMKANCVSAETLPIDAYIEVESARHLLTTSRPDLHQSMSAGHARRKRD